MKFSDFWRLYLGAHSLPGTRAMHYFATAIGAMSVVQAFLARQPLLLAGIALGYAIAIGAHWFIEKNQPLIRVNALWGAVADLRMLWMAITGDLNGEIIRTSAPRFVASHEVGDRSTRVANPRRGTVKSAGYLRLTWLVLSAIGLAAALLDLDDLFEPDAGLYFALLQLGIPIVAFAGAFSLSINALVSSHPMNLRPARGKRGLRHSMGDAATVAASRLAASEASLWGACVALLVFGALAMAMAECAEQGLSAFTQFCMAFVAITVLIATTPIFPPHRTRP